MTSKEYKVVVVIGETPFTSKVIREICNNEKLARLLKEIAKERFC